MAETKPFCISKWAVWDAWLKVKANQGAAGVDGASIAQFEKRLKSNLYKIWNRMSSGTYFPPPVRRVRIPKPGGGQRTLGIPTVGDRVAQMVLKRYLEPIALLSRRFSCAAAADHAPAPSRRVDMLRSQSQPRR